MDLLNIIVTLASIIHVVYSKDGKMYLEISMPTFLNHYFGLDQVQKTFRATVTASGEEHRNIAFDLGIRNNTKHSENHINQRHNKKELPKVKNVFQVKMHGIDDAMTLAKAVRSFIPKNLSDVAKALGIFEDTEPEPPTLNDLVVANKKRAKKITEFNFPKMFGGVRRNDIKQLRPKVEIGPGLFKPNIIEYPPNFFAKRLKVLVDYAKTQQEKEKKMDPDLNAKQNTLKLN